MQIETLDSPAADRVTAPGKPGRLWLVAVIVFAVLMCKVLLAILAEYPSYFPADFEAVFLIGRQASFFGLYAVAFYAHIIVGPIAFLAASFLIVSGHRHRGGRLHRITGRVQVILILLVLVPSGLVMASRALAGPAAGAGFAILSLGTGLTAFVAMRHAMQRRIASHRIWAMRCYVLLASPLLLRVVAGGAAVLQIDTPLFYRLNAWLSWLLPLIAFEVIRNAYRSPDSAVIGRPSYPNQESL